MVIYFVCYQKQPFWYTAALLHLPRWLGYVVSWLELRSPTHRAGGQDDAVSLVGGAQAAHPRPQSVRGPHFGWDSGLVLLAFAACIACLCACAALGVALSLLSCSSERGRAVCACPDYTRERLTRCGHAMCLHEKKDGLLYTDMP